MASSLSSLMSEISDDNSSISLETFNIFQNDFDEDDDDPIDKKEFEKNILDFSYKNDYQPKNPCKTTFKQYRDQNMTPINSKLFKKIVCEGSLNITENFERLRIKYYCEMFVEGIEKPCRIQKNCILSVQKGNEALIGITEALKTMKINEESFFWISSELMFGKVGLSLSENRIPPNADLLVKLRVISTREELKDDVNKTPFQKTRKSVLKRSLSAGKLFKMKDYNGAAELYRKLVYELEDVRLKSEEEEKSRNSLLVQLIMRASVCSYKLNEFNKVCIWIRRLEKYQSIANNAKALFIKGNANLWFNRFVDAKYCFIRALRILPDDENIKKALNDLEIKKEQLQLDNFLNQLDKDLFETKNIVNSLELQNESFKNSNHKDKTDEELEKILLEQLEFFKQYPNVERYILCDIEVKNDDQYQMIDKICSDHGFWLSDLANEIPDFYIEKSKIYYVRKADSNSYSKNAIKLLEDWE